MKIFLISGKAGCGKNEVGKLIQKNLPNTVVTGLSKYIKLFALEMTDWNGNDDNKPRTFLQEMGDKLRAIDEDFLTRRMLEDIKVYKEDYDNVVVSDLRLIHELDFFKKIDDYEIVSIRVNCDSSKRNLNDEQKKHHTELDLDNYHGFDYIIENKFDKDLENEVIKILEEK